MSGGQQAFHERLEKLGMAQDVVRDVAKPQRPVKKGVWSENLAYPLSFVGAFLVGLFSVFISRYVTSQINDGAADDLDLTLIMDAVVAFGIVFVLRTALHMTSKEHIACKTAGIWVSLTMMHNLVHAYPAPFTAVYTKAWVEQITSVTEPKSFFFRGYTFPFSDKTAKENADNPGGGVKINRF